MNGCRTRASLLEKQNKETDKIKSATPVECKAAICMYVSHQRLLSFFQANKAVPEQGMKIQAPLNFRVK